MKLALGTVSFGIDSYSVPNAGRYKPSRSKVFEMLDVAKFNGIKFIDTANAYGDAEDILGEYGIQEFKVTSKLKPNCLEGLGGNDTRRRVKEELQLDLKRLDTERIWGYYFHTPQYIYNEDAVDSLVRCKEEGLVENIGVSIYKPQDAIYATKMGLDIIQVPYNILDQRLHRTEFFRLAKDNNIIIFGRSPFLKGLLTLPIESIPSYLSHSIKFVGTIDKIISKSSLSRIEASLLFSITSEDAIDCVVFGVDTLNQLMQNIEVYENRSQYDFQECFGELMSNFQQVDEYIVMPSLWAEKTKEVLE